MGVMDVANAFDVILHKGQVGHVYNIGGDHEVANIQVARDLLKIFGKDQEEAKYIKYYPDRKFNDLRYTISSAKLHDLGWREEMGRRLKANSRMVQKIFESIW